VLADLVVEDGVIHQLARRRHLASILGTFTLSVGNQ
jgi:hypothetical protein